MRFEEVILLKPREVEEWVEQNMSLSAPLKKITMKFIYDPNAGWNQINKEINNIYDCNRGISGDFFPLGGVVKTGLCQADQVNYMLMSKTPVTDYIYRVLSNVGQEMDKGFSENFWKGVNQEKKAEILEQLAQVLKKSNEEIVSNFASFIEFIN